MVDEEVVVVVVVVADSTGCNGSASRLTRRTRLDLSTYGKHRERGGQETPTFSFIALLHILFLSFFLSFFCSLFPFIVCLSSRVSSSYIFRSITIAVRTRNERKRERKRLIPSPLEMSLCRSYTRSSFFSHIRRSI